MFGFDPKIPYWLEAVFEGLPKADATRWVIESTDAIPVGADLSMCHHELAYWLLAPDSPVGASNSHESVADAIAQMRECHRIALEGGDPDWSAAKSAAWSARSAAWSARSARSAESAAWSAAWSAERSAEGAARSALSAARSAWSAAKSAARAAAGSAARSAAGSAAWQTIASKSIEIFAASPVRTATADEQCEECVRESMIQLSSPVVVEAGDE